MTSLGTWENNEVVRTKIKVTRAGDGLSKALEVDPQLLHQGEKVFIVLECEVGDVSFKRIKDAESQVERVHSLVAGDAAIADPHDVRRLVENQKQRIIAAEEERKGITQVWDDESDAGRKHADHLLGDHDDPEPGCPDCQPAKATGAKKATKRAAAKKAAKKRSPRKARNGEGTVTQLRP